MLGALIAAVPLANPESIERTLAGRFGRVAEANIRAFRRSLADASAQPGASVAPERAARAASA
jgi:Pyruvate/2-oxoacid:ferredoxin oxidoreductase gamma subunit